MQRNVNAISAEAEAGSLLQSPRLDDTAPVKSHRLCVFGVLVLHQRLVLVKLNDRVEREVCIKDAASKIGGQAVSTSDSASAARDAIQRVRQVVRAVHLLRNPRTDLLDDDVLRLHADASSD